MSKNKTNVVYVVVDDLGFSQLGCYGSNINTPNINKLADEGLRYNNFHTTAICSATRASLLTGANHHAVGMSALTEFKKDEDRKVGTVDRRYGLISEILKENDYSTFAVGKWHLAPLDETTEAGPFDNWPLGRGFEKYYGFLHAFTDQYNPDIVQDNSKIKINKSKEYHLTEDITNKAIEYIGKQKTVHSEKPFFLYLAYGAVHAPHQAPQEYIDKYKGEFDEGWDILRNKWFNKQKEIGIIPNDAVLNERNEFVKPWDSLTLKERIVYTKYMENFAGFLEHTDYHIGRLINYLSEINELDNTIIVFLSDNGASPEGGPSGKFNHIKSISLLDGEDEVDYAFNNIDKIGSEYSSANYPIGWANLGNTPFQWYKTWVHAGGVKDPLIIRYPNIIKNGGGVSNKFIHVSDITPTILDVLNIEKPNEIKGIKQEGFHGIPFKYTFTNDELGNERSVQYFEMLGNRGIYLNGYKAVANHIKSPSFEEDKWELYNVKKDFTESKDLASEEPEKLKELIAQWYIEANKYKVLPLINTSYMGNSNGIKKLLGNWYNDKSHILEYGNVVKGLSITAGPLVDNRNHIIIGEIFREDLNSDGVIVSQGGRFGGNSIYIKDNKLYYTYNYTGVKEYTIKSDSELPSGNTKFKISFKKNNVGGSKVDLYVDNKKVGSGLVEKLSSSPAIGITFGADESPRVSDEYNEKFDFKGKINYVNYYLGEDNINYEEKLEKIFSLE